MGPIVRSEALSKMRSTAAVLLALVTLPGCSGLPDEYPSPDPADEIWLRMTSTHARFDCPFTTTPLWEGWVGILPPDECEPCECGPANCLAPSKVTANASVCPGDGTKITFDAGEAWDGSCISLDTPISGDDFASVTFHPPTIARCAPLSPRPEPTRRPLRFVKACVPPPNDLVESGWRVCYPPQKDGTCWKEYPILNEFKTVTDTRRCTPCSCGAPRGGACAVKTTLYQGIGCSNTLGSEFTSNKKDPVCTGFATGKLGSMDAVFTQSEPGTCEPTVSEIESGALEPGPTYVLCCTH